MDKWMRMEEELDTLRKRHLYREVKVIESPQSSHVRYRGRDMLMLASNSYLDLCNEERIKAYAARILAEYGTGSGGSRLTTGTTVCHTRLEEALARFKSREAAVVFNTGFAANSGVIPCLCREGDVIYSDALNHASIIDGCRQSRAETVIYRHNDMADLERKIKERPGRQGMIVSDGVFSMDGDIVDLPGLVELADAYGLLSMIDEAHATGVVGATGRGCEEHFHMEGRTDILMGTLSKAIGAEGGYVCGSRVLAEYLKNRARSYIFSTALPPVTVAAAKRALELIEEEPWRVGRLQENVRWFCGQLRERGIEAWSETAIIPIRIGAEEKAVKVSEMLMEQGFFLPAIRYPTVKKGEALLRAALMATHTKEELAEAAAAIAEAIAWAGRM
nr:8-amino-7-oxononanoate synthase [uncultured Acetatifactor sp.]